MDNQILYYYRRGVASYLIAKKMAISNTKVRTILRKHGIIIRSHNITNKMSAARRSPAENRALTKKAAEANTGSTHSSLHRVRLAASRQKNPKIDPIYEAPLIAAFEQHNIVVVPQKALYKYNVDLYLPEKNVVIEIFGGNFHNKPQAVKLFNNKINYLASKNIPALIVWADRLTYNPQVVVEVALRVSKPLTIIEGDGTPTTRGLSDIVLQN